MWWFPRLISPEANEALVHLPEVGDTPPRPTWDGGVPRRRLRDKTAVPQLSMLHMEGEGVAAAWIHTRLAAHRHHFDAIAPNAPSLFSLESWRSAVTVGRLKRPRGHRPRRLILRGVLTAVPWRWIRLEVGRRRRRQTTRTVAHAWWPQLSEPLGSYLRNNKLLEARGGERKLAGLPVVCCWCCCCWCCCCRCCAGRCCAGRCCAGCSAGAGSSAAAAAAGAGWSAAAAAAAALGMLLLLLPPLGGLLLLLVLLLLLPLLRWALLRWVLCWRRVVCCCCCSGSAASVAAAPLWFAAAAWW